MIGVGNFTDMTTPDSGKGHVIYQVTECYDFVISQIENALKAATL